MAASSPRHMPTAQPAGQGVCRAGASTAEKGRLVAAHLQVRPGSKTTPTARSRPSTPPLTPPHRCDYWPVLWREWERQQGQGPVPAPESSEPPEGRDDDGAAASLEGPIAAKRKRVVPPPRQILYLGPWGMGRRHHLNRFLL